MPNWIIEIFKLIQIKENGAILMEKRSKALLKMQHNETKMHTEIPLGEWVWQLRLGSGSCTNAELAKTRPNAVHQPQYLSCCCFHWPESMAVAKTR